MSPEQTIALAVECGAYFPVETNPGSTVVFTVSELEAFATSIAQQAIAEHLAKLQGNWLRSGDILYRPGEGQSVINKDTIQVTVADGSYGLKKRADAAAVLHKLLDASLPAKQQESAPVLPIPAIKVDAFGEILPTDGRRFVMGDFYSADQMRAEITEGGAK